MTARQGKDGGGGFALGAGALVMLVCCGSHLLALGAIGGLAAGCVFGVLAGVLVAAVLLTGLLLVRRRRAADAACDVPAPGRSSSSSASATRQVVSHER